MEPQIRRATQSRLTPHRRYFPIPKDDRADAGSGRDWYAGEPETCRRDARKFLAIFAHLGILVLVLQQYRVEGRGFQLITQLAFLGFPVHYVLPYRLKKPFFLALSVGGLGWVFGPAAMAWVVGAAALAIGACYLPLAWSMRAALVGVMGAAVLGLRAVGVATFAPETVWPVVGSMMMFRMMIYLYELKHAKKPEPVVDTLGYFFLLPNYCFLHFPVVDYRTLQRSYFSRDVHLTQQAGLRMIFRGTLQLLAYRLVYHELLITPAEVVGFGSLVGFLACNYLLYLQVSGQFHMACGILHLFGYSLPETHHRYLLATSFTDYWRRINIYWKDFMVRLVFNPVAFRLKHRPQWQALMAATVAVFVTTWALHAYQLYWLRGTWGLSLPDALFWGILGVLVLINVQVDASSPRRRPSKIGPTPRERALRALKVAGTLTSITLLWSLWSSPSVAEWVAMLGRGVSAL